MSTFITQSESFEAPAYDVELEDTDADNEEYVIDGSHDDDDDDIIVPTYEDEDNSLPPPVEESQDQTFHFATPDTDANCEYQFDNVFELKMFTALIPLEVQILFVDEFKKNDDSRSPRVTNIIDRDNGANYWIVSVKQYPKSLKDFIVHDYIATHDYFNPHLILRTDFVTRESNYVQTALIAYNNLVGRHAVTVTDVFETNPYPELPFYTEML